MSRICGAVPPRQALALFVEALSYKRVGSGSNSRWCHWNFSLTQSFRPHYGPGVDLPSNRNEYQEYLLGGKGCPCVGAGIALPVLRLATGWKVRGSNPGRGEIFRTLQDRPWGPPSLLHHGYQIAFPGVKRPGRGVDHPPLSSAEVKERVELYLYSPSGS